MRQGGLLVALVCLLRSPAEAQTRVQFPASPPASAPGPGYWPTSPPSYGGTVSAPPGYSTLPPGSAAVAPSLPAGTVLPPPPTSAPLTWDPYAEPALPTAQAYSPYAPSPYAPTPNTLPPFGSQPYTQGGYGATPYGTPPGSLYPEGLPSAFPDNGFFQTLRDPVKFLQEVRLRTTWIPGNGANALDLTEVESSASFAIPIIYDQAPLIVSPGFGLHLLSGPVTQPPDNADLPGSVYDAFLDFSWRPQFTPWLGANLGIRPGVYTDFSTFNTNSIRFPGRGLAVITLTPTLQILAGVVYLDRVKIKLLPAGGVIWTPNADTRWEIVFPNPKLASRLTTLPSAELWWYVAGEYGGGSWTIERDPGGFSDQFDYNDIRVMLGLETVGNSRLRAFMEAGYLFNRELVYRSGSPAQFDLTNAFMLRAGLAF